MIDIEEGPLSYCSSALSLIGGVHIGARALLDINLIWFGYIACLSQWGEGGGGFYSFKLFLPAFAALRGGGGGGAAPQGTV